MVCLGQISNTSVAAELEMAMADLTYNNGQLIFIGPQSDTMSAQRGIASETKEVAAISHAVDMLVNSQEVEAVGNRSSYRTFDPTPHSSSDEDLHNHSPVTTN